MEIHLQCHTCVHLKFYFLKTVINHNYFVSDLRSTAFVFLEISSLVTSSEGKVLHPLFLLKIMVYATKNLLLGNEREENRYIAKRTRSQCICSRQALYNWFQ